MTYYFGDLDMPTKKCILQCWHVSEKLEDATLDTGFRILYYMK